MHPVTSAAGRPTQRLEKDGWVFETKKLVMANAPELVRLESVIPLPHLPEMVFSHSSLKIAHESTGFSIEFLAEEALNEVDSTQEPIKVAAAAAWQRSRDPTVTEYAAPYDWTFSTPYRGTVKSARAAEPTTERIDIEKLKRQEPILFYDDVILFEDELGDNGTSQLSAKVRVMPSGWFVLLRSFVRVDGVLTRMTDTRIHYEFGREYALRQHSVREQTAQLLEAGTKDKTQLLNQHYLHEHMPVKTEQTDKLYIS